MMLGYYAFIIPPSSFTYSNTTNAPPVWPHDSGTTFTYPLSPDNPYAR